MPLNSKIPSGLDKNEPNKTTSLSLGEFYNFIASKFKDYDNKIIGKKLVLYNEYNKIVISYADQLINVKINGRTPDSIPEYAYSKFTEFNAFPIIVDIKNYIE